MIFPRRFDLIASFIALAFCILFFLPLPSLAQEGLNFTGASNCTLADFDSNLNFVNEAGGYYAIVVNTRNLSSHTCVFDGLEYGPSFVPDRVPGHEPFALCYGRENGTPKKQPPDTATSAEPGQVVRQIFRWRTTQSSDGASCLDPSWMSGPVLLVAPSLLKEDLFRH